MRKEWKFVLGIASIIPLLYVVLFILFVIINQNGLDGSITLPRYFLELHLSVALFMIFELIFFIIHVFRNKEMTTDRKILWAILLYIGSIITFPLYWFNNIYKDK